MKKMLITALAAVSLGAIAQTHVDGYYRSNGTYVQPHYRSTPDSTPLNNYSTQGNYNPYTGQAGHVNPYQAPTYSPPAYVAPQQKVCGYRNGAYVCD